MHATRDPGYDLCGRSENIVVASGWFWVSLTFLCSYEENFVGPEVQTRDQGPDIRDHSRPRICDASVITSLYRVPLCLANIVFCVRATRVYF